MDCVGSNAQLKQRINFRASPPHSIYLSQGDGVPVESVCLHQGPVIALPERSRKPADPFRVVSTPLDFGDMSGDKLKLEELFAAAAALRDSTPRAAFVARTCAADQELGRERLYL